MYGETKRDLVEIINKLCEEKAYETDEKIIVWSTDGLYDSFWNHCSTTECAGGNS